MALFRKQFVAKDLPELLQDAFYENIDPRRRQEVADSRMIQEDHTKVANLSSRFIHREFNANRFNQSPWIDDEIGGF